MNDNDEFINKKNLLQEFADEIYKFDSVAGEFQRGIDWALRMIIKYPISDVEEVVHSHWIKDAFCTTGDPYYTCANCGRFVRILYPNCPWCRAVMDADRTLEVDKAIQEIEMLEDLMEGEKN